MSHTVKLLVDETKNGNVMFKFKGDDIRLTAENGYKSYLTKYAESYNFDYGFSNENKLRHFIKHNNSSNTNTSLDSVKVLEDSINLYYLFEDYYSGNIISSTNLKSEFRNEYWNHDCPNLYVAYIRNKGEVVDLKEKGVVDNLCLLETYYDKAYVTGIINEFRNRITNDLHDLIKNYHKTAIGKEIIAHIKSHQYSEEELEKIKNKVNCYESLIQEVIDDNKERILGSVEEYRNKSADEIFKMVGLDSGFVNIYPTCEDIKNNLRILSNFGGTKWLSLNFPFMSQSTTIIKKQAYKLNEILKEKGMEELTISSQLD